MAIWFNAFLKNLQAMIKDIANNAGTLSGAATELSTISHQFSDPDERHAIIRAGGKD